MTAHRSRPAQRKDRDADPREAPGPLARRSHRGRTAARRRASMIWSSAAGSNERSGRTMPSCSRRWSTRRPVVCASDSRFGEAHVVERVAAMSAGRLTARRDRRGVGRFLASGAGGAARPEMSNGAGRREWSTVEHRDLEDRLLAQLHTLVARRRAWRRSGHRRPRDRRRTERAWVPTRPTRCGCCAVTAASVRALIAPAGFGKTTALHAAVARPARRRPPRGRARPHPQGSRPNSAPPASTPRPSPASSLSSTDAPVPPTRP